MSRFPKPFIWKPQNPGKYIGNKPIVSRSSWETRLFSFLDKTESVICWNSEDVTVQYLSPIDGRIHRYHVDIVAKMKSRTGEIKTYAIEIKPDAQTRPPVKTPTKKQSTLLEQVETYMVNQAKWKAAEEHFSRIGVIFLVLTEYDIGLAKRK